MSTEIRSCSRFTTYCDYSITQQIIDRIDETTTPTDFTHLCASWQEYSYSNHMLMLLKEHSYSLEHGDDFGRHALSQAAYYGNTRLVAFLYKKGGAQLLELGNRQGFTALHIACQQSKEDTVRSLVRFGSPINVTTTKDYFSMPKGATCLDIAIKVQNVSLIAFLKLHGGVCQVPIAQQDQSCFDKANQLIAERSSLTIIFSQVSSLPYALNEIIIDYASFPK